MSTKTTHLLLMIAMIAAGVGLMLRSLRDQSQAQAADAKDTKKEH
jgi:hypothetical protein